MVKAIPIYSNGIWGHLTAVDVDGIIIQRPTGATKTETYTYENPEVELICPDPTFEPMTLILETKVFSKEVPDVDPRWLELEIAGLLPDLTSLPEPYSEILARSKSEKLASLEANWLTVVAAGVTVGEHTFGILESDISLLTGSFVLAQTAVSIGAASADGPFTLIDIQGRSLPFTFPQMTQALLVYGNTRTALSATYANAKVSIESATTVEELEAIYIFDETHK